VADVVAIVNRLFDPKNLINNAYLVSRSKGTTFEIPVLYIYEEFSVRNKTQNIELIDQALEKAENVYLVKRNEKIEAIKPKVEQIKAKITILGVEEADKEQLNEFAQGFLSNPDDILSWSFNKQMNLIILNCKDEEIAFNLYNNLTKNSFKGSSLQCSLDFLTLYISALENVKKNKKNKTYQPQYRPNNNYMMNPYNQMYYPQMQYGYNMYGNPNMYTQGNINMGVPMNMQNNGMGSSPNGNFYNNNYQKRNFYPNKRGGFNKYRNKNNFSKRNNPSNINMNENEFPPLNNEGGNEQE